MLWLVPQHFCKDEIYLLLGKPTPAQNISFGSVEYTSHIGFRGQSSFLVRLLHMNTGRLSLMTSPASVLCLFRNTFSRESLLLYPNALTNIMRRLIGKRRNLIHFILRDTAANPTTL